MNYDDDMITMENMVMFVYQSVTALTGRREEASISMSIAVTISVGVGGMQRTIEMVAQLAGQLAGRLTGLCMYCKCSIGGFANCRKFGHQMASQSHDSWLSFDAIPRHLEHVQLVMIRETLWYTHVHGKWS